MPSESGAWPTPRQELLLKSALLPDRVALESWDAWNAVMDVDRLHSSGHCLLPLIYRNLSSLGAPDPTLGRLKGTVRYTWSSNLTVVRAVSPLLAVFEEAGIDFLIVGDAALAAMYYPDAGLRPIHAFHAVVRPRQARAAMAVLRGAGWTPAARFPEGTIAVRRSCLFRDSEGRPFHLRWRLLRPAFPSQRDGAWRAAPGRARIGPLDFRVLDPAEGLLDVCAAGPRWNTVPPVQWIADAMMILRRSADLDWDRFIAAARAARAVLPARESLAYLSRLLGAPVPPEVLERLA